ncbi:enoyl-[acyl-carrier-protein] reductase [Anaeramoeba flamelloides]|uniref:enoyl-[acyl-carrier-protein] reductase n=1 Tax=Anaeramoeba flamelloides TaxID=1746091 RepID=A0ABQ8YF02_9EUKA|nr:enoyl-[acyl-carrier-protein] reductase [Anaeramoeba flamelloides]
MLTILSNNRLQSSYLNKILKSSLSSIVQYNPRNNSLNEITTPYQIKLPEGNENVMNYMQYSKRGNPLEVLSCGKHKYEIHDDQVCVALQMSSLNPADLNTVEGRYPIKPELPAIGGNCGFGVVTQVGKNIKNLSSGDWVIPGKVAMGTWSTHLIAEEQELLKIPKVRPEFASILMVNPPTAYRMLHDFTNLKKGDWIIQNGATTEVGRSVIYLASKLGFHTLNFCRKGTNFDSKKKMLKDLGADLVLSGEELKNRKMMKKIIKNIEKPKLGLNCVGDFWVPKMASCMAKKGVMVTYGGLSVGTKVAVNPGLLIFNDLSLKGFWLSRWVQTHSRREREIMLEHICEIMGNDFPVHLECHNLTNFKIALKRYYSHLQGSRKIVFLNQY